MTHQKPADYEHLICHVRARFPGEAVRITYTEDERIHIDVGAHRYTFDIGSDDDEYLFVGQLGSFSIPLIDWD